MATSQVTPATEEKTYTYFSADTFESVSETVKVPIVKPVDLADAMNRIGNDQGIVLKALTGYLQRAAYRAAKREVLSKGVSKKVVLSACGPFRAMPPWSAIEDRKEQTKQIIAMLRSNPLALEAIKAASAAAIEADVDSDDDGGGEDN